QGRTIIPPNLRSHSGTPVTISRHRARGRAMFRQSLRMRQKAPLLAAVLALTTIAAPTTTNAATMTGAFAGRPDHVVVVVMENKRYDAVIGNPRTLYISSLAATGANFTNAYAETHPSQPNYLALLSGSTQGVTDNRCGHTFTGVPNLARQLLDAG